MPGLLIVITSDRLHRADNQLRVVSAEYPRPSILFHGLVGCFSWDEQVGFGLDSVRLSHESTRSRPFRPVMCTTLPYAFMLGWPSFPYLAVGSQSHHGTFPVSLASIFGGTEVDVIPGSPWRC